MILHRFPATAPALINSGVMILVPGVHEMER